MTDGDAPDLEEHVRENQRHWDAMADDWVASGERNWTTEKPTWGIWGVPESELTMLPRDMTGMRAVELGCGTGYVSAWMARRGARVTGIDASERQLATARRLAKAHGIDLELVHGDAEATPFPDGAFDFAISEYGAAIWCDPYRWIPEAWRLLKPGGRLAFLANHPLVTVCSPWDGATPIEERLVRPYFGLHRVDWTEVEVDPGGVEFTLPLEDWFALFRRTGFVVEDLREPRPTEGGTDTVFFATADWARRWPTEIVFKLRKGSATSVTPARTPSRSPSRRPRT
jgi:SAM-dependent methyltransferase